MTAVFQDPMFQNETKAREALESVLWPEGPICRHCGNSDPDKIAKMEGKSHRPGLYYCNECHGQFTVTVGTVFERSKVPLTKWWMAAHMLNSGKNGCSAHEIHRALKVTYKTAWFMMHRLREAMTELNPSPMGGEGQSVQADETYYGNSSKRAKAAGRDPLNAAALAKGRHRSDAANYRGLGYRTDTRERGRLVELFYLQSENGSGITKNAIDVAIAKYHAKLALLDVKKAEGKG